MTNINQEWVRVRGPHGDFEMYVARPRIPGGPAVILAHEIYGPTAYMRGVCEELASYGCFAGCPNLFWRTRQNYELGHDYDLGEKQLDWKNRLIPRQAIGTCTPVCTTSRH